MLGSVYQAETQRSSTLLGKSFHFLNQTLVSQNPELCRPAWPTLVNVVTEHLKYEQSELRYKCEKQVKF